MAEKYVFTEKMQEISGFGGSYEDACRKMVVAGLEWFDKHPKADPKFSGYKGVYGIINEDNQDAKDLTKTMLDASGGDCTGAMMQATVTHVMHIHKKGWDWYVKEMTKPEKEVIK